MYHLQYLPPASTQSPRASEFFGSEYTTHLSHNEAPPPHTPKPLNESQCDSHALVRLVKFGASLLSIETRKKNFSESVGLAQQYWEYVRKVSNCPHLSALSVRIHVRGQHSEVLVHCTVTG
jgi:hypothetical protein